MKQRKYGVRAGRELQTTIKEMLREMSPNRVAALLNIGPSSVTRIAAGQPVIAATLAMAQTKLEQLP